MIVSNTAKEHKLKIKEHEIEKVNSCKYVGTIIQSNGKTDKEINKIMKNTERIFNTLKNNFF